MLDPKDAGTVLEDRILWFDGSSTYKAQDVDKLLRTTPVRFVDEITPDIKMYNNFAADDEIIGIKEVLEFEQKVWNIPAPWNKIDVEQYVFDKLDQTVDKSDPQYEDKAMRCALELSGMMSRGLYDVLRAMIYVINMLEQNSCVWGVGRGSCVASYVLYLIGVHDIDSFEYDLDIHDFLHD